METQLTMDTNEHVISKEPEVETRQQMIRYWQVYKPSLESMMLSNDAKYLAENEQNELLSYLPSYKGQKVLELGAGIGRFTPRFAQIASHVTAIDFMESYIKENEKENGHFGNISFQCADVTKLNFAEESFDLIFSNWLLMYLSNGEVESLIKRALVWLKPNGYLFFRESCYHQSGNVARSENPTKYRSPMEYIKVLQGTKTPKSKFSLQTAKSVLTYVHYHGNPNQLCLLAKKSEREEKEQIGQEFETSLSQVKASYPHLSLSGEHMLKNLSTKLGLRAGQRVLNIGCGTGEMAFFLTKHFGVFVHAVDCSPTKIHLAIERQGKLELDHRKKIQFEATDLAEANLPLGSYEFVLSFDVLQTDQISKRLIIKAKDWLKPGGKLINAKFVSKDKGFHENTNGFNDYNKDFESENQLTSFMKCQNYSVQEMKSESKMALKWLKELSSNLTMVQKAEKWNEDLSVLENVDLKIRLIEDGSLEWIRVTALLI